MKNISKHRLVSCWGAILFAGSLTATQAGISTYPDLASWTASVGSFTTTSIPDPSPSPFIFFGSGSASVTYGGVVFSTDSTLSDGNFFNVGSGFSGAPAVLSSQLQTFGVANILITFPSAVEGFALNYGTFGGSAVVFTLGNGDSFTQGSAISGYDAADFAGATDTTPFTTVLVTSVDSVLSIKEISRADAVGRVPELSTFGIDVFLGLPLALQGLRCISSRRKK